MTVLEAIILGLVQGITEFIPVSSSGHLVLTSKLLGISNHGITFEIFLHVATLLAVIIVMRIEVLMLIKKPLSKLMGIIAVATMATAVLYLIFDKILIGMFETGKFIGFALMFTALVLFLSEKAAGNKTKTHGIENTGFFDSVIIGIAQGIALIPGVSRSGTTISAAIARNLDRKSALKFSFLLSIPAITGAFFADLYGIIKNANGFEIEILPYMAGFIAAFISGYLSIKFLISVVTKRGLKPFTIYVTVLAFLVLADQYIFNLVL